MLFSKGRLLLLCSLLLFCLFNSESIFAWDYEASGGFGYGPEFNGKNYNQVGGIADFVFMNKAIDPKLHFLWDISAAYWHAESTPSNGIFVGAISPILRAYFVNPETFRYRPFLQIGVGPAFISSETLGDETQGSHFLFQDRFGVGMEVGSQTHALMFAFQYIHCSNAGIAEPNPGFNFPFVGSIGYEF